MFYRNDRSARVAGFVADGYLRLLRGVDAEVRQEVEVRYAEKLAASGWLRRFWLRRKIAREVDRLVAERTAKVSEQSLF